MAKDTEIMAKDTEQIKELKYELGDLTYKMGKQHNRNPCNMDSVPRIGINNG